MEKKMSKQELEMQKQEELKTVAAKHKEDQNAFENGYKVSTSKLVERIQQLETEQVAWKWNNTMAINEFAQLLEQHRKQMVLIIECFEKILLLAEKLKQEKANESGEVAQEK